MATRLSRLGLDVESLNLAVIFSVLDTRNKNKKNKKKNKHPPTLPPPKKKQPRIH